MSSTLLSRHEVSLADTWDLTPLFVTDQAWEDSFQELVTLYPTLADFRGNLGTTAEQLLQLLEYQKKCSKILERKYKIVWTIIDNLDHYEKIEEEYKFIITHLIKLI